MTHRITRRGVNAGIGAALITPALSAAPAFAAGEPIKIGFSMAQTGSLAGTGQQALLGMKIWEEDINAKGGLLGRPVKLVYYDDQTNPSSIPGIYTKLMDVDKVDLVVGLTAPIWSPRPFRSSCRRARSSSGCSRSMRTANSTTRNISR